VNACFFRTANTNGYKIELIEHRGGGAAAAEVGESVATNAVRTMRLKAGRQAIATERKSEFSTPCGKRDLLSPS
jgi:copper(I)-binding protein